MKKDLIQNGWEFDTAYLDQNPRMRLEIVEDPKKKIKKGLPVWGRAPGTLMKYEVAPKM